MSPFDLQAVSVQIKYKEYSVSACEKLLMNKLKISLTEQTDIKNTFLQFFHEQNLDDSKLSTNYDDNIKKILKSKFVSRMYVNFHLNYQSKVYYQSNIITTIYFLDILLLIAARYKELGDIKSLIKKGAKTGAINFLGENFFHCLMRNKNITYDNIKYICKEIKDKEIDTLLNLKNKQGETPLLIASELKDCDTIMYLIKKGAKINITDNYNKNLLHYLANNKIEIIELLCILNVCKREFTDKSFKKFINSIDSDGLTPLLQAVKFGTYTTIKSFLHAGKDEYDLEIICYKEDLLYYLNENDNLSHKEKDEMRKLMNICIKLQNIKRAESEINIISKPLMEKFF